MMRSPIRCEEIDGLGYSGVITFSAHIPSGRGLRKIAIQVPSEEIVKLGAHLAKFDLTKGCGHAVWHWQNPDRVFPCQSCELAPGKAVARA